MAQISLISPKAYQAWDYRNPDDPGIGGSETMHVEMATRLAARGHFVTSYSPIRPDTLPLYRGVTWRDLSQLDPEDPGLYILIRAIEWLDKFEYDERQRIWAVFQDVDTYGPWDFDWRHKLDRIIALCPDHEASLKTRHPDFASKVCLSRNGLRGDLVDHTLRGTLAPRNPHRLMYASSPDRGLLGLTQAFKLIRFLVPDAELHVFYGWDNIDTFSHGAVKWHQERVFQACQQPGLILRGRIGQPELYREWTQTGLMCAPTNFTETGYITLMEAQALGAIPVCNPIWAAKENQLAGIAIEGDAEHDPMTIRRYAMAAVHLLMHPEIQEALRPSMMQIARKAFDWEEVVSQYETWIAEDFEGEDRL